jgi:hypothetical protein
VRRVSDRFDAIEGCDHTALGPEIGRAEAGECQHLTRVMYADVDHTPAATPDAHEVACPRAMKFLHCAAAARAQKLPHVLWRGRFS